MKKKEILSKMSSKGELAKAEKGERPVTGKKESHSSIIRNQYFDRKNSTEIGGKTNEYGKKYNATNYPELHKFESKHGKYKE